MENMDGANGKAVWLKTLDTTVTNLDSKVDKLLEGQIRLEEREARVDSLKKRVTELEVSVQTLSNQYIQMESEKTTKEKMFRVWAAIYVAAGTIIATVLAPIVNKFLTGG